MNMRRTFVATVAADLISKQLAFMFMPGWAVFNLEMSKVGLSRTGHIMLTAMFCLFFWEVGKRRDVPVETGTYAATACGGAIANLLSYVSGPAGVLDFIPLGPVIANFADFAIWVGTIGVVYHVARQALTRL